MTSFDNSYATFVSKSEWKGGKGRIEKGREGGEKEEGPEAVTYADV